MTLSLRMNPLCARCEKPIKNMGLKNHTQVSYRRRLRLCSDWNYIADSGFSAVLLLRKLDLLLLNFLENDFTFLSFNRQFVQILSVNTIQYSFVQLGFGLICDILSTINTCFRMHKH